VRVSIITAGATHGILDGLMRKASQAHFGRAAKAGMKIYEYEEGTISWSSRNVNTAPCRSFSPCRQPTHILRESPTVGTPLDSRHRRSPERHYGGSSAISQVRGARGGDRPGGRLHGITGAHQYEV